MRFLLLSLTMLALMSLSAGAQTEKSVDHYYNVIFSSETPKMVTVEASMVVNEGKIEMAAWGHALQLKDSWAHFVKDISASHINGQPITLNKLEGPEWQVNVENGTEIKLRYRVVLNHSDYDWHTGGGNDARPEWTGKNLFLITKALFIVSYTDAAKARVKLKLPDGWNATTAWDKVGDNLYETSDLWALIDNALVVGKHESQAVGLSGMNVRVVTDQALSPQKEFMIEALHKQLIEYGDIFGEIPAINYLITFRKDVSTDGEAFNNSFSMIIKEKNFKKHTIIWAGVLAHEMFHYWTGPLYGKNPHNMDWFKEGFTEHYASLTLARTGIINDELWFKKLERYLSRYYITRFRLGDKPSLVEAGKNKMKNWFLIYGGGASIALALDIKIREATEHEKSLDDVMRVMYKRHANKPYTMDNLLAVINEVSGQNYTSFFEQYVYGKQDMPDYAALLKRVGLTLSSSNDEFYISVNEDASKKQKQFYRRLLKN